MAEVEAWDASETENPATAENMNAPVDIEVAVADGTLTVGQGLGLMQQHEMNRDTLDHADTGQASAAVVAPMVLLLQIAATLLASRFSAWVGVAICEWCLLLSNPRSTLTAADSRRTTLWALSRACFGIPPSYCFRCHFSRYIASRVNMGS
jgi:hypothetical protein